MSHPNRKYAKPQKFAILFAITIFVAAELLENEVLQGFQPPESSMARKTTESDRSIMTTSSDGNSSATTDRRALDFWSRYWATHPSSGSGTGVDFDSFSWLSRQLPLDDLVNTFVEDDCPDGLVAVQDRTANNTSNNNKNNKQVLPERRIPRIIHVTSKSRCVTPKMNMLMNEWKTALPDHDFYFHNDAAVDRLLYGKFWSEFPSLAHVMACSLSGAAKADMWRALVLWEYGGVYTDIDNAPRSFNSETILPNDEAYFLIEQGALLSQYFFASMPKHPMMYLIVQCTLVRLLTLRDVDTQYVPYVTGPGGVKMAFLHFMRDINPKNVDRNDNYQAKYGKVTMPGTYTGMDNWTVTVAGTARTSNRIVGRGVVRGKQAHYAAMNMTHFNQEQSARRKERDHRDTCLQRIYYSDPYLQHYRKETRDTIDTLKGRLDYEFVPNPPTEADELPDELLDEKEAIDKTYKTVGDEGTDTDAKTEDGTHDKAID